MVVVVVWYSGTIASDDHNVDNVDWWLSGTVASDGMCPSAPHTVARKDSVDLPERFYIIAPHMFICQKVFCRYARKILHNSPKVCIHLPKISPNQIWSLAIMTLYYYRMMLPIQSGHSVCPVNLDNCLTSTRYHMSNK